jgi:hypothetical protein
MADYESITVKIGNLKGICPDCDALMNRRVSAARFDQVRGNLQVTFPQAPKRLNESIQPSLNGDFRRETSTNAKAQCPE